MDGHRIAVLIVDDQPLIRTGLRTVLECEDDLDVVGAAGDAASALAMVRSLHPDVVLLDIRMPGRDGIDALREITADQQLTAVRVIVLTTFDLDEYVTDALGAGASGFLLKDTEPDQLVHAVRVVARGDALLDPAVTRQVVRGFVGRARQPRPGGPEPVNALTSLTAREGQIVTLVAHGMSNHEIAARLVVSPATVRTHVSRSMTKLGARDRAQLVVIAYRSGLVPLDT